MNKIRLHNESLEVVMIDIDTVFTKWRKMNLDVQTCVTTTFAMCIAGSKKAEKLGLINIDEILKDSHALAEEFEKSGCLK